MLLTTPHTQAIGWSHLQAEALPCRVVDGGRGRPLAALYGSVAFGPAVVPGAGGVRKGFMPVDGVALTDPLGADRALSLQDPCSAKELSILNDPGGG